MRVRVASWWFGIKEGLWFVPAIMTASAVVLALVMIRLDQALQIQTGADYFWAFGGGAEGARGVLSAIAGTMITVTGVVFSITIVALQLASSQFTPRVLRTFTADRVNQVVLGILIGTFTYALLVQRSIRSFAEDRDLFVPKVSVTVAIVLALASIAALIVYIHHAARSIQASVIIDHATADTLALIDDLFPADIGRPSPSASDEAASPTEPAVVVHAAEAGYLRTIDGDALFSLAEEHTFTLRAELMVGAFVLPGVALASIWPATALDSEVERSVRSAFILGPERTLQSDVELGIRQVADIAVRALSPGINDPTTAIICLDRLSELLTRAGNRELPAATRTGCDGSVRLILRSVSFAHLVDAAFTHIRHYGTNDVVVTEHLIATLGRIAALVPPAGRLPLIQQAELILAASRERLAIRSDLERVERAAAAWIDTQ